MARLSVLTAGSKEEARRLDIAYLSADKGKEREGKSARGVAAARWLDRREVHKYNR